MQNWDDLRYFSAVSTTGSLTAASVKLGVNQSTVSRRIAAFEKELNVRLFERFSTGYELTPEGQDLLARVRRIEEETHNIDRLLMGKNIELRGVIRVTCSLVIAQYFLIPVLNRFHQDHPGIEIHLDTSTELHNLTAREADVAIRVTPGAIPETLVGSELGAIKYAVYGHKEYLQQYMRPQDRAALQWVGEDDNNERPNWLPPEMKSLERVMRCNDVFATLQVLKSGLGVGRLPQFMGDNEPDLTRLELHQPIPPATVWLLTHADMRRVNRITAFTGFIRSELNVIFDR